MFFFPLYRESYFPSTSFLKSHVKNLLNIWSGDFSKIQQKYNLHVKLSLTYFLFAVFLWYFIYMPITAPSCCMTIISLSLLSSLWNEHLYIPKS